MINAAIKGERAAAQQVVDRGLARENK